MSDDTPNRKPITVRLDPADKIDFTRMAETSGMEPGVIARSAMQLLIRHARANGSVLHSLALLEAALSADAVLNRPTRDQVAGAQQTTGATPAADA